MVHLVCLFMKTHVLSCTNYLYAWGISQHFANTNWGRYRYIGQTQISAWYIGLSLNSSPLLRDKLLGGQQKNFSLVASFWGICLLLVFIFLRLLKLASSFIFHSYKPQRWWQANWSQFINRETSFAIFNTSSVL